MIREPNVSNTGTCSRLRHLMFQPVWGKHTIDS